MSFRLRVLALVILVTLTATAATAWLTLRAATRQVQQTVIAGQQEVILITGELARYGREKGSWAGVESLVTDLARQSGQRVRLANGSGALVADSDVLAGLPERPTAGPASLVDPRPVLELESDVNPGAGQKITAGAIMGYHFGHQFKQCLLSAGVETTTHRGVAGIDAYKAVPPQDPVAARCRDASEAPAEVFNRSIAAVEPCTVHSGLALRECLQKVFLQEIATVAPEPLHVHIGVPNDTPATLQTGPIALAAAVVALIATAGALLLSRHVLRPIRALTNAASRLGQGRLAEPVPVMGRDELAMLSHTFNRMAQSLEQSEERQRRMIADIAHELRTPLVNLRGYLEALTDGTTTPSPELFVSLRDEALLQQRIIDDLQDLALAEAGALTYHRSPVDLSELAETCRAAHLASDVTIITVTDGPVYVDGDPDRLRQVLSNFVRNALRATGSGGQITLTSRRYGPLAKLTVADTGTGIIEKDLPHLFDRFWRADSARSRSTGGSGLGLAIAKQIITDHGGKITVASQLGRGTAFTITLPAIRSSPGYRMGGPA